VTEQKSQEPTTKYLKQVCFAVAILLVLYGIVQVLNFLSDFASIYVSYYLWVAFQIIAAILIIFIGFRVYSIAKTIKATNLTQLWKEVRPQLLGLTLGCFVLVTFTLYPLPASNPVYPQIFQPYSGHYPISFPYRLNYRWNLESGGSIQMYTTYNYPTMPYQILVDVISVSKGWVVIPYEIDGSNAILQAFGPAGAEIKLGVTENGNYIFKVVMSDAIDIFEIHKTDNKFWLEEVRVTRGSVVQKDEFDKRLDGFKVEFVGFPNIDNETKDFVLENIQEIGGEIIDTESYYEGWTISMYFYYGGDVSNLRQVIIELAKNNRWYWIRISSNMGWFAQTSQYRFLVIVRPENADSFMELILQKGFQILEQKREQSWKWEDSVKFDCSSAPLNKTWAELRENLIKTISEELGLRQGEDFWISY
jgi:hypothetical protein